MRRPCAFLVVLAVCLFQAHITAGLELPSVIGDHMVLQRETDARIWGWDEPGSRVTVEFRGRAFAAVAGDNGRWQLSMPTGAAGGPSALVVRGTEERRVEDVMVGEVWVAGGQSNMWWAVSNCGNARQVIAEADYPAVRFYDANTHPREAGWLADEPQRSVATAWQVAQPGRIGGWAGVAYFFALELHKELGIPVGILHVAVPGTRVEPWLSPDFFRNHFRQTVELAECRARLFPQEMAAYRQAHADWERAKAEAEQRGEQPPPGPRAPREPQTARTHSRLYSGMIAPVAGFASRGFIWWQGESNARDAMQYRELFPSLIRDWRRAWGSGGAPFLFVELAEFLAEQRAPVEDASWPALRDAQHQALRLPHTYMVSAIDIFRPQDDVNNIHPPHKQQTGHRLFLTALANVYGRQEVVWSGPMFESADFESDHVRIRFGHIGGGLVARGGALKGFAIAGEDRNWHWAEASIDGAYVMVHSAEVQHPLAVRYNWANNPVGNLYNAEGLPAFPFRTDQWLLRMP